MTGQKELYDIFELIYPVGIIIELATNANPKNLFGIGEWEQIKDRFILAAGDSYAAGNTGGASTHVHSTENHTLTVSEIPYHTHSATVYAYPTGAYSAESARLVYKDYTTTAWISEGGAWVDGTGGGAAHNHGNTGSTSNMPPYYVAYLWRRVS